MSTSKVGSKIILRLTAVAAFCCLAVPLAKGGGPLLIGSDGKPFRWPAAEVRGGPLNSQTVGINQNGVRQVFYRVDSGPLGTLDNAKAASFVDRIFRIYTDIPTADIDFVNAGPIIDPSTGNAVDVNGTNAGRFLSNSNPTFQNPIIFDSDGSITGRGGVLGFFTFLQFDDNADELKEAAVVLNGSVLTRNQFDPTSFLGVFTHEFGHFAGPLDHSQINGNIAAVDISATVPNGYTPAQAYDVFAPFTETLYPFLFDAPFGSQLGIQFPDSGFFVATVDLDTQNAFSNLYPSASYLSSTGAVEGSVVVRTSSGDIPITGVNVVARRISQGPYPPVATTQDFPTAPVLDPDGVPSVPPALGATDSLATVSSAVTGLDTAAGTYRIQGLPPGDYLVGIQQINPDALGGSGIGPLSKQIPLPFAEEFYNGPSSSSNTPAIFTAVTVSAGSVVSGIDIIINGISNAPVSEIPEVEPNDKMKKPEKLAFPVSVTGNAASTDAGTFKMTLPDGSKDVVEDLYRITVDQSRTFFILLNPISGDGDLDLYLFDSTVKKKKSSFNDSSLVGFSAGPTATESIVVRLTPGTYSIGVSAFAGSAQYKLSILATDQ
jgi:hypothetical protein